MTVAIAVIAVLFAILRFVVPVSGRIDNRDIFKDLAHIFVGFAFGYGVKEHMSACVALALSAVEVIAFFVRRK